MLPTDDASQPILYLPVYLGRDIIDIKKLVYHSLGGPVRNGLRPCLVREFFDFGFCSIFVCI